jgi:hypothetical protein
MASKLDKYIGKSIYHINSYVLGITDVVIPDKYVSKLEHYGGKLSTDDIILELYKLLINIDNKKMNSKVLNRVMDILILCCEYIPDEPSLKTFIANMYLDMLFTLILVGCPKKINNDDLLKLTDLIANNYLNFVDMNYNFPLSQKLSKFANPLLVVVKLLNKTNKSNKYVQFLKSRITPEENKLLNEQLGGLDLLNIGLNYNDEFNNFNSKLLDMVGSGGDGDDKKKDITPIEKETIIGGGIPTTQPDPPNKGAPKYSTKIIKGLNLTTKPTNSQRNAPVMYWYQEGTNPPQWYNETIVTNIIDEEKKAKAEAEKQKNTTSQQQNTTSQQQNTTSQQQNTTEIKQTESVNKLISELSPTEKSSLVTVEKYLVNMYPKMLMNNLSSMLRMK